MIIPNEKQVSVFRKFFLEYTVIVLMIAVVTLFGLYYNLNKFITQNLMENNARMERIIERNSDILLIIKH